MWQCLFISAVFAVVSICNARCIWYDECYQDSHTKIERPCPYFGEARPLDEHVYADYLVRTCPNVLQPENGTLYTCCSLRQVRNLRKILEGLRKVAGHCPSCYRNMANLFCSYICSPDQDTFMWDAVISQPSESTEVELPEDPQAAAIFIKRHPLLQTRPHDTCSAHSYVSSIGQVRISERTAHAIVRSCENVVHENRPIFSDIFGVPMTPFSLFQYIGNPRINRNVGVRLGFVTVSDDIPGINFTTYACDQPEPTSNKACACKDCPMACDGAKFAAHVDGELHLENDTLLSHDHAVIAVICIASLGAVLLALAVALRVYSDNNNNKTSSRVIVVSDIGTDSTGTDDGKTQLDSVVHEKDDGFWQRLGSKFWTKPDYYRLIEIESDEDGVPVKEGYERINE